MATVNGPNFFFPDSGQYCWHFTLLFSMRLVSMTIMGGLSCHMRRQKSTTVRGMGPALTPYHIHIWRTCDVCWLLYTLSRLLNTFIKYVHTWHINGAYHVYSIYLVWQWTSWVLGNPGGDSNNIETREQTYKGTLYITVSLFRRLFLFSQVNKTGGIGGTKNERND